jgi:hypothetical protein
LKKEIWIFLNLLVTISLLASSFTVLAQNFKYVLGTDFYAPSDSPLPQKGIEYTDQNFHTAIVRITDKTEYPDTGIENEYSKNDAENCDGTIVILRGNQGEWYLYDTTTFEMKLMFGSWFVDGVEPDPRWSATDPKVLYYVYETELRTYNLDTDTSTVVHDFKSDFPSANFITNGVEGAPSLDQRYWAFMAQDSDYNLISAVVYDKQTDNIVGHRETFPDKVEDIGMSMSGSYCYVGYDERVMQLCSRDFGSVRDFPDQPGHNDFAFTADGREVLVYQNIKTDYICMADLGTLVETQLLWIPFTVNIDIGLHISGNCADKPGWVLVSTYGAKQAPPDGSHSWMDTQLFMLELKQDPTVWRIAHTHAYTSDEYSGEKNYFAEAYATINKEGSRVYFGSNWGDFAPEYTDTYMVTLPSGWATLASESALPSSSPPSASYSPSPSSSADSSGSGSNLLIVAAIIIAVVAVAAATLLVLKRKKRSKSA